MRTAAHYKQMYIREMTTNKPTSFNCRCIHDGMHEDCVCCWLDWARTPHPSLLLELLSLALNIGKNTIHVV